jgi:hypothetical protein
MIRSRPRFLRIESEARRIDHFLKRKSLASPSLTFEYINPAQASNFLATLQSMVSENTSSATIHFGLDVL